LLSSSGTINDGDWHHVAISYDGTTLNIYVDGSLAGSTAASLNTLSIALLFLGRADSSTNFFNGSITGIRLYGSALSGTDIATLASGGSPSTAPIRLYNFSEGSGTTVADTGVNASTTPQVVCDGNSHTSGTGSTNGLTESYPGQMRTALGTWSVVNTGVGGRTMETQVSQAAATVDIYHDSNRPKNIVIAWGDGINSIIAGDTAAQAYAAMTTYIQARKIRWKVIVSTTMKWSTETAGNETTRLAYNALVIANSAGADAVVDMASNLDPTVEGPYYSDGTHTTNAGYAIAAGLFKTALLSL
jgi:lysophospholipase L1-like esterase